MKDTVVERTARDLIARAYVDGGSCLDGVRGEDMERLARLANERRGMRGEIERWAWHLVLDWQKDPKREIDWSLLERLHRAVLARWPKLHERTVTA